MQQRTDGAKGRTVSRSPGKPLPSQNRAETHSYNLVLPKALFLTVQDLAKSESSTVLDTLRRLIRYGLLVFEVLKSDDAQLFIREGGKERQIVLG